MFIHLPTHVRVSALDCRSLDHDARIFEVIEAYCQSSQNRMTLHSGESNISSQPRAQVPIKPVATQNQQQQQPRPLKAPQASPKATETNFEKFCKVESPFEAAYDEVFEELNFTYSPKPERKQSISGNSQNVFASAAAKRHSLPALKKVFARQNNSNAKS